MDCLIWSQKNSYRIDIDIPLYTAFGHFQCGLGAGDLWPTLPFANLGDGH